MQHTSRDNEVARHRRSQTGLYGATFGNTDDDDILLPDDPLQLPSWLEGRGRRLAELLEIEARFRSTQDPRVLERFMPAITLSKVELVERFDAPVALFDGGGYPPERLDAQKEYMKQLFPGETLIAYVGVEPKLFLAALELRHRERLAEIDIKYGSALRETQAAIRKEPLLYSDLEDPAATPKPALPLAGARRPGWPPPG